MMKLYLLGTAARWVFPIADYYGGKHVTLSEQHIFIGPCSGGKTENLLTWL